MRRCLLVLSSVAVLTIAPGVFAQSAQFQGQFEPPGKREIAKYPLQLEPPQAPQRRNLDPVKLRAEATELADLARGVPSDLDQLSQGKLPKDFAEKLKRIEKLSKHLRNELTP